ncbi:hypothetical protein ISCGN_029730 [Ixodes scapularis]
MAASWGAAQFQLRLSRYSSDGTDAEGQCCGGTCPGSCRTLFRCCLTHYGPRGVPVAAQHHMRRMDVNTPCSFGLFVSDVVGNNSMQAEVEHNFTFDLPWPLPTLPTGEAAKLSVVLHADFEGRPYRLEDFRDPFKQVGVLSDVAGLGAYQMSHVWLLKLRTPEAKPKLLQAGSLQVKGKTCLSVDPNRRELRVKLHWVSFDAPVDSIRRAFEPFGEVKEVSREKWKVDGFVDVDSTTVVIRLALKEGVALESLPHQLRVSGGNVLVVVPGRAPICLRCRRTGHIPRDCRAPRCTECRAFGHEARDCVKTYARAASSKVTEESTELLMDEDEAEQAASPATSTASVAAAPEGVAEPSDVNAAPVAGTAGRAESPDVPSVEASRPGNTAAGTSDVTAPDLLGESPMEDQDSSASDAASKRTRDDGSGDPNVTSQEEPPSKAAPLWRRRLQVKQNIPVKDQKGAQPSPYLAWPVAFGRRSPHVGRPTSQNLR